MLKDGIPASLVKVAHKLGVAVGDRHQGQVPGLADDELSGLNIATVSYALYLHGLLGTVFVLKGSVQRKLQR